MNSDDWDMRFGALGRLYGVDAVALLRHAHFCVIGLGGIGSWTAEALARSGIGRLTLIDLDDVCVTNVNRQIHAVTGNIGRSKVRAMSERIAAFAPDCEIVQIERFFLANHGGAVLPDDADVVVDAIDSVPNKCALISMCRDRDQALVVAGGAGGKRDPGAVRVADLGQATHDPLLRRVRRILRRDYGYSRDLQAPFGVSAVYGEELPVFPRSDGTVSCEREQGSSLRLDCASGFGTAGFVTGAFGFAAAGAAVNLFVRSRLPS